MIILQQLRPLHGDAQTGGIIDEKIRRVKLRSLGARALDQTDTASHGDAHQSTESPNAIWMNEHSTAIKPLHGHLHSVDRATDWRSGSDKSWHERWRIAAVKWL